jgi:hypothetical protein
MLTLILLKMVGFFAIIFTAQNLTSSEQQRLKQTRVLYIGAAGLVRRR